VSGTVSLVTEDDTSVRTVVRTPSRGGRPDVTGHDRTADVEELLRA